MWARKNIAIAMAVAVAGCASQSAGAQMNYNDGIYYGQSGGGQYGGPYGDQYGDGYYNQYDQGQFGADVSFAYFHDSLAPHGQWFRHARWGDVWRPSYAGSDFRPYYSDGYWRNTIEFGWTWTSDYAWGHIPFHYGRWIYDPYDGWLWIPGYVWAPSWVIWRSGGSQIGWFPMPPTNAFLFGAEIYSNSWSDWDYGFGYANWYGPQYGSAWAASIWVFVDQSRFGYRDFHRWAVPRDRVVNIVHNTTNVTNYVTINNYVVNRSVDTGGIERASGRRYTALPARDVLRRDAPVTRADRGEQVQERERPRHGGNSSASPRERLTAIEPNPARDPQIRQGRRQEERAIQPRQPREENAVQRPAPRVTRQPPERPDTVRERVQERQEAPRVTRQPAERPDAVRERVEERQEAPRVTRQPAERPGTVRERVQERQQAPRVTRQPAERVDAARERAQERQQAPRVTRQPVERVDAVRERVPERQQAPRVTRQPAERQGAASESEQQQESRVTRRPAERQGAARERGRERQQAPQL